MGIDFVGKFKRDPLGTAEWLAREFGDFSHLKLGPYDWYTLIHPDQVKDILVTRNKIFGKTDRFKSVLGSVDGKGLVLSEGELWLKQRRIIQPLFHHERLEHYARIMTEAAANACLKWSDGTGLDFADEMTHITLTIIARVLFGVNIESQAKELGDAVSLLSHVLYNEFSDFFQMPDWLPLPSKTAKRKAVQTIDNFINRALESNAAGEDNMTARLLAAVDHEGDGTGMSRTQARDEAITMFNAGHDTSAAALAWAFYLLARHKDVYDEFLTQVDALPSDAPTIKDLEKAPLALWITKEALRLYPPAWTIPRQVIEDVELCGYELKTGALVNFFPWVTQRDERFWENANSFVPSRFAPVNEHKLNPFAFFPFGAGPRSCIGREFAMMEMQLILITVSRRFRVRLVSSEEILPNPLLSLEPKGGVPVTLEAR